MRTAFKETGHPGGEEFLVGVGGDVVSGVGAVVVVGDDVAQQRGGLTAGAAARDVHPGVGVAVFVVAFAGGPGVGRSLAPADVAGPRKAVADSLEDSWKTVGGLVRRVNKRSPGDWVLSLDALS